MKDIVIDNCIMRLFDKAKDPVYLDLFRWVKNCGVLSVSQKLINEYYSTQGGCSPLSGLINFLIREKRLNKIKNNELKEFKADCKFKYSCNYKDINHAKLVFLSTRKKLVSGDNALIDSVNRFPSYQGVKPEAIRRPPKVFYE